MLMFLVCNEFFAVETIEEGVGIENSDEIAEYGSDNRLPSFVDQCGRHLDKLRAERRYMTARAAVRTMRGIRGGRIIM